MIGWYRAMFRIWCMVRGEHWMEWEAKRVADPIFVVARRNRVVDVAW